MFRLRDIDHVVLRVVDLVPVDGTLGRAGGAAPVREGRNLDHFCLRVEPFDASEIQRHLAARGFDAGPVGQRYGAEGDVVELKGPPDRPNGREAS